MNQPWHYYLMAVMYIFAGIMHFVSPKTYMRIMPRFLPAHKTLVYASGLAEIAIGAALFVPELKAFAIYSIIAMLLVFMLVHVNMLTSKKAGAGIPVWVLILRLPLQFGLMYWAYQYL